MAEVLAEAVVELEADIDKANKELKKAFKEMDKDAKEAASDIDKSFKQLSGNLGKEFEQATREAARQFREQEREAKRTQREIEREAKRVARELEREARDVRRAWERELRAIARENARVQREIEAEIKRTQREIERETARVARENAKAQKEYEREFIESQRAMERATQQSQERQAAIIKQSFNSLRRFASERLSLTLGVDSSQVTRALGTVTKLGAVLGGLGAGALIGQASLGGLAAITVAVQELVGAIALLPAAGAAAGAVVGTLALGLRGLSDAIKADSPEELAEAFKLLSKNGQEFVTTIRDLKDEFDDLSKSVQQELLAGLSDEISKLATTLLPILRVGFTETAKEINLSTRALIQFVRESQTVQDIDRIFANTQSAIRAFRAAIQPAARALRDLAVVGSDFLPNIAAELRLATIRFADFVAQARASGELHTFFENAIDAVKDFISIIGNIGSIFNAISNAAEAALGGGFLDFLRLATQELEDFLESARGQMALIQFFEGAQEAAKAILPVLGDLARLVLEVVLPALTRLGTIAAPGLNALVDGLRNGLERALPGIYAFVDALSDVVTTLVDMGVLDALGNLVKVLGTSLGSAIRDLAPKLANLVSSVLLKLADILPKILPALSKFAGAFADLVIAALPVVDVLADIISEVGLPTLQRIAEKLTPIISDLATGLSETLLPVLPDLAEAFGEWVDAMAPLVDDVLTLLVDLLKILVPLLPSIVRSSAELAKALQPILDIIVNSVKPLSEFITKLYEIPGVKKFMEEQLPGILALITGNIIVPLGKIIELIDKFITKLDDAGIFDIFIIALDAFGKALNIAASATERFGEVVSRVFSFIREVIETAINFIIAVISTGFGILVAIFTTIWETIKAIVSTAWEIIKIIISTAVQVIIAILSGNFSAIPGIISNAMQRMRDAVTDGLNRVLDAIRELPGRITSALGNLGNLLYGAGQSIVQGLINGIQSMIGSLASRAANMAKSALDAAKSALGVSSPSKMMLVVGEEFGRGFVVGIDNMLRKASEAGADLASQTVTASTTALSPSDNATFKMNETLSRLTRDGFGPVAGNVSTGSASVDQTRSITVTPEIHVYIGNEEIDQHVTEVVDERNRQAKRSLSMGARRTL